MSTYAQFIRAQGFNVFEAEGSLWVNKRNFFYESIPQHRQVHLSVSALNRLSRRGAAVVRYTCSQKEGRPSFEYVCAEKTFTLQSLAPEARRRVRRGLEACDIRPVDFDLLARYGCAVNRSTFARQGRTGVAWMREETLWKRYMQSCAGLPDVYAFGAFVKGQFCGFSMAVIVDDYAYLFHTQALTDYLPYSPINALTYTVTRNMLQRPEVRNVSQGLESFKHLPDVENFKLAMGFRKRALGRRVFIHPLARPLFSAPVVWLTQKALSLFKPGLGEDLLTFASDLKARKAFTTDDVARIGAHQSPS